MMILARMRNSKVGETEKEMREERKRLIRKAKSGDKEAARTLRGAPYFLKVYTPEEIKEYGATRC